MSIAGINTNAGITAAQQTARKRADIWNPNSSTSSTPTQDSFTSDFASILASVQSGDITGAQAALAKLTGDQVPTDTSYPPSSTSGTSTSGTSAGGSSAQNDVQSLLQAVQGGDITAAQKALTSLRSDMQADAASATSGAPTQPVVHHHHHHHHAAPAAPPTDPTTDSTGDPTSSDSPFDPQAGSSAA